jgi:SAM-dependent methyltransferase
VPADDVSAFVHSALPPAPARVLEVGAGDGALAAELTAGGYDVVPIDPDPRAEHVRELALHELPASEDGFDAAVAVVSLHHVEPLAESCSRLADAVRPGGALVIDEFDVGAFDERAARWLLAHRIAHDGAEELDPDELVSVLRDHLHSVPTILDSLGDWFRFETPVRGPYLYRWDLPDGLLDEETRLVADGSLPATGVRAVGTRAENR